MDDDPEGGDPQAWEELAGHLEGVLDAQESGLPDQGVAGTPLPPQGLPVLERLASLTERLEDDLAQQAAPPYAAFHAAVAPRPEDLLPSPTTLAGVPNPTAAFYAGQPYGLGPDLKQPLAGPPAPAAGLYEFPALALPEVLAAPFPQAAPPAPELPAATALAGAQAPAPAVLGSFPEASAPTAAPPTLTLTPAAPPYGALPGFAETPAPAAAAAELAMSRAPETTSAGGFALGASPAAAAAAFPVFRAPAFERLPMGGSAEAPAGQAGQGGGEGHGTGLLAAIQELRDALAGLKGDRHERAPGPQRDGSFVPGGQSLLGSSLEHLFGSPFTRGRS